MDSAVIAQLGPVIAYEIKTSNVNLYVVKCSRCGLQQDYHSLQLALATVRRHAGFCERPTSR
jgi:hypothetical protein